MTKTLFVTKFLPPVIGILEATSIPNMVQHQDTPTVYNVGVTEINSVVENLAYT
jgi:hypothetical protein